MGIACLSPLLGTEVTSTSLAAYQFYAIKLGSSGWALPTVQGEVVDAILQDDPASGIAALAQHGDVCPAIYGGTVTAGDPLTTDSGGKLITASAGEYVIARAIKSGVANDQGTVLITHEGVIPFQVFTYHFNLADIADGDLVSNETPGPKVKLAKFYARVTKAATTGSKASTLNLEVGTTNVTGGSLALTSANMTPIGNIVSASAITAGNVVAAAGNFSIEAASTTAFAEGEIDLVVIAYQST